ncbi:malonyl-coenzyme A:anthocyanin 3-O-glucoside-6''-O-malonyltransferase-like [Carex rostrata]
MAAAPSSLRIIETTKISPPPGSVPETSIPLTFFDVLWLNSTPVQRLFFYPYQGTTLQFTSSHLPALKSSLSIALQSYFPFAGNIRVAPGTIDKYEIHYRDGDSVTFIVAESDDHHHEFIGDEPRLMSKLKTLVPHLNNNESNDDLQPVLAIQATVFSSHGVAIGITVNHSVCDGSGSVNFMRAWAAICRSSTSNSVSMEHAPAPPIVDRSIIPDSDGSIYTAIVKNSLSSKDFKLVEADENKVLYLASFTLKRDHVNFLKEKFRCEAENRKLAVPHCSTAVVTYAFIWIGYLKAKSTMPDETKDAYCLFAADLRRCIQPAIPENYFGNCIGPCFVQANARELHGPNGFFEACQAISKAFEEVKKVGISDAKDWMKNVQEKVVRKPLSAAGSLRFRVYDVDFGWGKPAKVDIVSVAYSGAMALAESREEQGVVEIGLPFTQQEIEVFKDYYYCILG